MKLWRPFLVGLVLLLVVAFAAGVPKPALAQWDDYSWDDWSWDDYSWDDWSYDYSYDSWDYDYSYDYWDYGYSDYWDYSYDDYWSWDYGYDYDYWSYDYWSDYWSWNSGNYYSDSWYDYYDWSWYDYSDNSPYAGTTYVAQQDLVITLADGSTYTLYGDIFSPEGNLYDGKMAVRTDYLNDTLRAAFDAAGIPEVNGYYLIHDARNNPNVTVDWSPEGGLYNVNPNVGNPAWGGGGTAYVTFLTSPSSGTSSGDSSTGGSEVSWGYSYSTPDYGSSGSGYYTPPDTRSLLASVTPAKQEAGKSVQLEAVVSGTTSAVTVSLPWGGSVNLTNQGSGRWTGSITIPYETTSGSYRLVFEADISQPPHYGAKKFQVPVYLEVLPPPDTRSLNASLLQPVVRAGGSIVITAEVSGQAEYVRATVAWGASVDLQKSGNVYQGVIPVPETVSGVLPITVVANISQPPHYAAKQFTQALTVTVKSAWEPGENLPPVPSDSPDWWTPPWAQPGW